MRRTFLPLYVEDLAEPEELRVPGAAWDELRDWEGFSTAGGRRCVDFCEFDNVCMAPGGHRCEHLQKQKRVSLTKSDLGGSRMILGSLQNPTVLADGALDIGTYFTFAGSDWITC